MTTEDAYQVESAAASIIESERPCVLLGAMPEGAAAAVSAFCRKLSLPLFPLGAAPDHALKDADLVLLVGVPPEACPPIGASVTRIDIAGECGALLESLLETIGYAEEDGSRERAPWLRSLARTEVRDNAERHRFELVVDGETAFVTYAEEAGLLVLLHTEVPAALGGRGVGSALARGVLDEIRRRGARIVPRCAFIAGFIQRNPDFADLVA